MVFTTVDEAGYFPPNDQQTIVIEYLLVTSGTEVSLAGDFARQNCYVGSGGDGGTWAPEEKKKRDWD